MLFKKIIDQLELQSHSEGGYFKDVYRSEGIIIKKTLVKTFLGNETTLHKFTPIIKAKDWFAAKVIDKNVYSLVGCTVAPGFDFNDFELPKRDMLISKFPEHRNIIPAFTRF